MIALPDGLKVYPEDIENIIAAHPRIAALATPLAPRVATVIGLEPAGEPVHVHAVFLEPKDPTAVEEIVRKTNRRLSQKPADPWLDRLARTGIPDDAHAKGQKREVIERVLGMAAANRRKRERGGPSRELSEVGRLIAQVANVPPERIEPHAQLSATSDSTRSRASIYSA